MYLPMPQAASSTDPPGGSIERNRSTKVRWTSSISFQYGSLSMSAASSCRSFSRRSSESHAARSPAERDVGPSRSRSSPPLRS